jgi:hypothetical protein
MSVIYEGTIKGAFKGFKNRDTTFEFNNGSIWQQNEYKYHYHYAYRPEAKVIDRNGRYYIEVEGVSESVEVKRIK